MLNRIFRIGTRRSPLALRQVDEVIRALKEFEPEFKFTPPLLQGSVGVGKEGAGFTIVGIDTYGDKDKTTPISEIEGSDFFTREIDVALLEGKIDFAVHSAKDLPDETPQGLVIIATTKPKEPFDALVSKNNLKLNELRAGAKIGASSQRRKTQLKKYRKDFQLIDIRGNIQERLKKLDNNGLDAIVVATAALARLGLEHRITQRIPLEILTPHPLQGALAIAVRKDDRELIDLLKVLDGK